MSKAKSPRKAEFRLDPEAVRRRRLALGWTQEKLADKADYSKGSVSSAESGRGLVTRRFAESLARALGMASVDDLLLPSPESDTNSGAGAWLPTYVTDLARRARDAVEGDHKPSDLRSLLEEVARLGPELGSLHNRIIHVSVSVKNRRGLTHDFATRVFGAGGNIRHLVALQFAPRQGTSANITANIDGFGSGGDRRLWDAVEKFAQANLGAVRQFYSGLETDTEVVSAPLASRGEQQKRLIQLRPAGRAIVSFPMPVPEDISPRISSEAYSRAVTDWARRTVAADYVPFAVFAADRPGLTAEITGVSELMTVDLGWLACRADTAGELVQLWFGIDRAAEQLGRDACRAIKRIRGVTWAGKESEAPFSEIDFRKPNATRSRRRVDSDSD